MPYQNCQGACEDGFRVMLWQEKPKPHNVVLYDTEIQIRKITCLVLKVLGNDNSYLLSFSNFYEKKGMWECTKYFVPTFPIFIGSVTIVDYCTCSH